MLSGRKIRASLLASHTKDQIDDFIKALNEVDSILYFKKC